MASQTPQSAKESITHGSELKSSIKWLQFANEELKIHVNQFIKGSNSSAHVLQLSERDLLAIRQEAVSKATHKKLTGNVAQKGG